MDVWEQARTHLDGLPQGRGLNITFEAVDRHVAHGHGERQAFRFIDAEARVQVITYAELARLSNRFANALATLQVSPGEVVFTMAGRVPEVYIAALGALKARVVFSALFANFGQEPARTRLAKGHGKLLLTTKTLYQRRIAAIRPQLPDLASVVVIEPPAGSGASAGTLPPAIPGTIGFAQLLADASDGFAIAATDPEDPSFLHFTSGTRGLPKGALHVHGAVVAQHATAASVFDLRPDDVYWCTADPGWVTGLVYGLVAPLSHGVTVVVDQAEFDPARWYRIIQEQRVTVWYTSPTAIRLLMKAGSRLARSFDLSSLRLVASVGEPLNPEAVRWGRNALGRDIHDTWWQTETGAIMIATRADEEVVLGAMGSPVAGIKAAVGHRRSDGGLDIIEAANHVGELVLEAGWPSMFRGYIDEPERYARSFVDGWYLTGDLVSRDADGRFWFVSRGDEVIKSAGHLVGPFEVESSLLEHPAVAEAGVIGKPDPLIGETVKAFVTLKDGFVGDEALRLELLGFARRRLGPALAPREISFLHTLPKTRNGKILRRLLRARELGLSPGDLVGLDPGEDQVLEPEPDR